MTVEDIAETSRYSSRQLHLWFEEYLDIQSELVRLLGCRKQVWCTRDAVPGGSRVQKQPLVLTKDVTEGRCMQKDAVLHTKDVTEGSCVQRDAILLTKILEGNNLLLRRFLPH